MKKKIQDPLLVAPLPLQIYVGTQWNGYTFQLRPRSRVWLEEHYPTRYRLNSVYIGFEHNQRQEFQQFDESVWEHVSHMLTGLSQEELNQLGGVVVLKPGDAPGSDQQVYNSLAVYA